MTLREILITAACGVFVILPAMFLGWLLILLGLDLLDAAVRRGKRDAK